MDAEVKGIGLAWKAEARAAIDSQAAIKLAHKLSCMQARSWIEEELKQQLGIRRSLDLGMGQRPQRN